jgi:hypothetical protein
VKIRGKESTGNPSAPPRKEDETTHIGNELKPDALGVQHDHLPAELALVADLREKL